MRHPSLLCTSLLLIAFAFPNSLPAQTPTFAAPKTITFTLPDSAGAVAFSAADFNADGKMDYLLEPWNQGALLDFALLLGNGYGSFTLQNTNVPVPVSGDEIPARYAVADVNNDGKADIITLQPGCTKPYHNNCSSGTYGELKVYLNQGGGRFIKTYSSTLPQYLDTLSFAVSYFNGDRLPDIAVLSSSRTTAPAGTPVALNIFLNTGDGLFTRHQDTNLPSALANVNSVGVSNLMAGDFTGNGRIDLAFNYVPTGTSTYHFYRLPNNGSGTFGTPVYEGPYSSGITGDINKDGKTDMVYILPPNRNIGTLLAKTGGGFTQGPTLHYYIENLGQIALGDLNGDGKLDLALSGTNAGGSGGVPYAALYSGYGNGSFNTSYKAFHPSGPWIFDPMVMAPLRKGQLPSVMFQTGAYTLELYINTTVK